MTDKDIREAISVAVKDAFQQDRDEFWVKQPQHFIDHKMLQECQASRDEWRENHKFISGVRESIRTGKRTGWVTAISAVLMFLFGAIVFSVKQYLKG